MRSLTILVLALTALPGCAAELGGHTAIATDPLGKRRVAGAWAGHAAGSIEGSLVPRDLAIFGGGEFEGRNEWDWGARWTTGGFVGLKHPPRRAPLAVGEELRADFGTSIRHGSLFPNGDYYLGGTFSLPMWISRRHEKEDLNASLAIVQRAALFVPYARVRYYKDEYDQGTERRVDVGLGIALRLLFYSDFFEF